MNFLLVFFILDSKKVFMNGPKDWSPNLCLYLFVLLVFLIGNVPLYLLGSGSKPKACKKAGAHIRDIPRYKGYVTGARLARQAPQF